MLFVCVAKFYGAGAATRGRRIGSWNRTCFFVRSTSYDRKSITFQLVITKVGFPRGGRKLVRTKGQPMDWLRNSYDVAALCTHKAHCFGLSFPAMRRDRTNLIWIHLEASGACNCTESLANGILRKDSKSRFSLLLPLKIGLGRAQARALPDGIGLLLNKAKAWADRAWVLC
jgi:hypothetical protein